MESPQQSSTQWKMQSHSPAAGQADFLLSHYLSFSVQFFLKCVVMRLQSQPFAPQGPVSYSLPDTAYISSFSVSLTSCYLYSFLSFYFDKKSSLCFMFISFKYLSALLLSPFSYCLVQFMFSTWQLPSDTGKKIFSAVRYSFRVQAAMYIFRTVYGDWDVDGVILLMSTAVLLLSVLGPWFYSETL